MSEFLHRLPEFLGNHPFLAMAFFGVLLALIANESTRWFRGYKELTPAELTRLINSENALVVDVSSSSDYEKGHVPTARNVAMAQFDPEHKDLAKVKDKPVAVICRSGQTSAGAAARLAKAGFTRVYTLAGGTAAWQAADLPLHKGRR